MDVPREDDLESLLAEPDPATEQNSRGRLSAFALRCRALSRRRPVQGLAAGLVALLVAVAALLIVSGGSGHKLPPTPPSPAAAGPGAPLATHTRAPSPTSSTTSVNPGDTHCAPTVLAPVDISIPSIGVQSCLLELGLNADRTVQTPTLRQVGEAGWYRYSSQPGSIGPTVILGHIDSAQYGPGIFFKLGTLNVGDTVKITRADHLIATFTITQVAEYPKTNFPTQKVYGPTTDASLRLITCGGDFDAKAGSYVDNIVAYGNLVSLTHA
jgi:sortase (surface protein transpeptidase)